MLRDLRVCFFGDSLVYGSGDPDGLGWVGRLLRDTRVPTESVTPYNLGIGGDTAHDVQRRWSGEATARLKGGDWHGVVFSFGVNDTSEGAGVTSAGVLASLLEGAKAAGWPALVVGPPPVTELAHTQRIRSLSTAMAATCVDADVPYLPLVDRLAGGPYVAELAARDGYHPGRDGYELIAETVGETWVSWLAAQRTGRARAGSQRAGSQRP